MERSHGSVYKENGVKILELLRSSIWFCHHKRHCETKLNSGNLANPVQNNRYQECINVSITNYYHFCTKDELTEYLGQICTIIRK